MNQPLLTKLVFNFLFLCTISVAQAQITVSGTNSATTIIAATATAVAPDVTVAAGTVITDFTVSIVDSYSPSDVLSYSGSLPSGVLAEPWSTTTRSLVFTGSATAAEWQSFLRTVTITSGSICSPETRKVSFAAGETYYNPLNGHFYRLTDTQSSWTASQNTASSTSYYGREGYLVTLTNDAENTFVSRLVGQNSWMGASDDYTQINNALGYTEYANENASEGKFYWVTGPERGTQMTTANGNSNYVPGVYQNWRNGEPNDYGSGESFGHVYTGVGDWNDFPNTQSIYGIIEFGDMPNDVTTSEPQYTQDIFIQGSSSGSISGGEVTVCSGINSTTLTLNGLTGTVVRWESSTNNFITTGTSIANTTTTLNVSNISETTYYRAVVNSTSPSACNGLLTSSTPVFVSEPNPGNVFAENTTICAASNVELFVSGQEGTVQKWQWSPDDTNWTDIASTETTLTENIANEGTRYYRVLVEIVGCGAPVASASKEITIVNGSAPIGGAVSSATHATDTNSGTLSLTGQSGTISKWQRSTDNGIIWIDIANTTTSLNYSNIGTKTLYRAQLVNGSCGSTFSGEGSVELLSPPSIGSFTPTEATEAETVIITGTNFEGATQVAFGGVNAASFTVDSNTQITALLASGASGDVTVTTAGGTATSNGFTYVVQNTAPTVTSASITSATAQSLYYYDIKASDADNDVITWTANTVPAWLTFTSGTLQASFVGTGATPTNPGDGVNQSSDGTTASMAVIRTGTAAHGDNKLFFTDTEEYGIRYVDANGTVQTWYQGDGTFSNLNPVGIAYDAVNDAVYVGDYAKTDIVKIDNTGTRTLLSNLPEAFMLRLLVNANGTRLFVSARGGIYEIDLTNNDPDTNWTRVVGTGSSGYSDTGTASTSQVNQPNGMAFDSAGRLVFTDRFNDIIRRVNLATDSIETIAGTQGAGTEAGDGGPAINATFADPSGLVINEHDEIFISERLSKRIRKIDTNGDIDTFFTVAAGGFADDLVISAAGELFLLTSTLIAQVATKAELTGTPTNANAGVHNVALTLSDGMGNVPYNFQITVEAVNTAPTASSVSFSGNLGIGQTLTGSYSYNDQESDTESGTTLQWYRSDDGIGTNKAAISGATADTYVLIGDDLGKYISFEVTPRDGSDSGSPEESALDGPIVAYPVFVSAATTSFAEGATGTVLDIDANDGDGGATDVGITYVLASGGDNDLFSIDGSTGVLSFQSTPDYESSGDANNDNDYEITVTATDSDGSSDQAITISVTDIPDNLPVFTSPEQLEDLAGATNSASFNLSVNTSTSRKIGLEFSTDGTRMFSLGFDNSLITEYVLSTPFDITTAAFHFELDVSANGLYPRGLAFNDDGSKVYVYSGSTRLIYAYDLSVAFDLSTATIGTDYFDVDPLGSVYLQGLDFNPGGTKMYIVNHDETVLQFELTTPFLISSASSLGSIDLSSRFSQSIYGVSFNSNGTQMYIGGYNDANYIIGYDLSVPYDITSATVQPNNGLVLAQPNRPTDIFFSTDRTKVFVLNYGQSQVYEFDLGLSPLKLEENTTTPVVDVDANNGDGGSADSGIAYTLANGGDNDLLSIDGATGVLTFLASPDFENPADANTDNIYDITIVATDNDGSTNQPLKVQVTDVDDTAPDGYMVSIDQDPIASANHTSINFTFAGAEIGTTYNYSFDSDNGGTTVTGIGTITTATDQITAIDLSGLAEGLITLTVTLTDSSGNEGNPVQDSATKNLDQDNDGISDDIDNCSSNANADQLDTDNDGEGDVCDTDDDNDGTPDTEDAFPLDPNEDTDTDGDGTGDNTDTDDDNDGQSDADETSCGSDPLDAASMAIDTDGDSTPDCVDTDDDNDGTPDTEDAFPLDPNEDTDTDGDGTGDNADDDDDNDGTPDTADAFPLDPTEDTDTDGDGTGDNTDTDDDNDGTPDAEDAFSLDENEDTDTDGDGTGDNEDTDDDNDGTPDTEDAFPLDENEVTDTDGDGTGDNADTDDDNDDVEDSLDDCSSTPAGTAVDASGCPLDLADADNDGIRDEVDNCIETSNSDQLDTDLDGQGDVCDTDDDNDGTPDAEDAFPLDENEDTDTDGDGTGDNTDTDDDNDGIPDTADSFPNDPNEDTDTDGDGTGDNADVFPNDPNEDTDTDGDGIGNNADEDDDNDGDTDEEEIANNTDPLDATSFLQLVEEEVEMPEPVEPTLVPAEAFTPNGDGINDTWVVPGINNHPNNTVRVYNRWGHEVFAAGNYQNDWTGRHNANSTMLPTGSYLYVIDLGNGTAPLQGWIFINY